MQSVIDSLALDYLHISLSHITGEIKQWPNSPHSSICSQHLSGCLSNDDQVMHRGFPLQGKEPGGCVKSSPPLLRTEGTQILLYCKLVWSELWQIGCPTAMPVWQQVAVHSLLFRLGLIETVFLFVCRWEHCSRRPWICAEPAGNLWWAAGVPNRAAERRRGTPKWR